MERFVFEGMHSRQSQPRRKIDRTLLAVRAAGVIALAGATVIIIGWLERAEFARDVPPASLAAAAMLAGCGGLLWWCATEMARRTDAEREVAAQLERAAARTTRRLRAHDVAAQVLARASNLADALPEVLRSLNEVCAWHAAALWTPDEPGGRLRRAHVWQAASEPTPPTAGHSAWVFADDVLATRAIQSRRPQWNATSGDEVSGQPRPGNLAVPIPGGEQPWGVLEFAVRELDADPTQLGEMLGTIAGEVGHFLQRQNAAREIREARAAAEAATRAKSGFLAVMSHEIRTPLNSVIGMADILRETTLTPRQQTCTNAIRQDAGRLLAQINDVLDYARLEAGKLTGEKSDFDLRGLIEDVLESFAPAAHAKQLELAGSLRADVPTLVRGNPARLRQVLQHLLGNAVKFTAQGEIVVTVATKLATDTHVVAHISVRDTGPGIAADLQKRLFQPFSQADTSTKRRHGGAGLGLAIARQLVELMHGRIGVLSEPGEGATFHFTIRLERQAASGAPIASTATPHHGDFAGRRVLVVEDNVTQAGLLARQLTDWRMRPALASDAAAALQLARDSLHEGDPFAIALIDAALAGPGLETARALVDDLTGRATPVVLLAPIASPLAADASGKFGTVSGVVTKPIRQARLRTALAAALNPSVAAAANPAPAPPPVAASGRTATDIAPALRILVAEDNLINQQVALEQLACLGCTADVVTNGVDALAAVRRQSYDVILMDCAMPEMDGLEATLRIRELERQRARLGSTRRPAHIVAMTAHTATLDRTACLKAGMNEFVPKPVELADLRRLLLPWLRSGEPTIAPAR